MNHSRSSLITIVSVFFFWGFVASSNDILIPVFKEKLHLEQWQSQLISFAFYIAYTVGSVFYFLISRLTGGDLLNRMGYKNGLVLGLLISAVGALMFYPAAEAVSFPLTITALFVVALGFSLQQTAANPMVINLGDPKKGSQRLSLAGGINNVGTTIAPGLVSFAIFGAIAANTTADIDRVKLPYLALAGTLILAAIILKFSSIPNKLDLDKIAEEESNDPGKLIHRKFALDYPQLGLGMLAIFVYVGVEVSTGGNLGEFMKQHFLILNGSIVTATEENILAGGVEFPTKWNAPFISLFWASLMIGRWTSAASAFDVSKGLKYVLRFLLPYLAFGLFLGVNAIFKHDLRYFIYYPALILVLIACDFLSRGNPARQLMIFSFAGIVSLLIGIFSTNAMVSVYAFMSVGLFCSTLWPCVFTLAIAGLGKHTNEGSGFLVLMICGGGLVSMLQGYLAGDALLGIQKSYFVGVACFAYLAFYAIRVQSILRSQGIDYDKTSQID